MGKKSTPYHHCHCHCHSRRQCARGFHGCHVYRCNESANNIVINGLMFTFPNNSHTHTNITPLPTTLATTGAFYRQQSFVNESNLRQTDAAAGGRLRARPAIHLAPNSAGAHCRAAAITSPSSRAGGVAGGPAAQQAAPSGVPTSSGAQRPPASADSALWLHRPTLVTYGAAGDTAPDHLAPEPKTRRCTQHAQSGPHCGHSICSQLHQPLAPDNQRDVHLAPTTIDSWQRPQPAGATFVLGPAPATHTGPPGESSAAAQSAINLPAKLEPPVRLDSLAPPETFTTTMTTSAARSEYRWSRQASPEVTHDAEARKMGVRTSCACDVHSCRCGRCVLRVCIRLPHRQQHKIIVQRRPRLEFAMPVD